MGSLSNRIGEEILGEALTVIMQLMLLFDYVFRSSQAQNVRNKKYPLCGWKLKNLELKVLKLIKLNIKGENYNG